MLLGFVTARPLAVVADATVPISVYDLDQEPGWTPQTIRAVLGDDRRQEGP